MEKQHTFKYNTRFNVQPQVQTNAYFLTRTQYANFRGNPLYQAILTRTHSMQIFSHSVSVLLPANQCGYIRENITGDAAATLITLENDEFYKHLAFVAVSVVLLLK